MQICAYTNTVAVVNVISFVIKINFFYPGEMELDPLFAESDGGEDVDVEAHPASATAVSWRFPIEEPDRFPRQSDHYSAGWPPPTQYYAPNYTESFEARRKRALETDAYLRVKKPGEHNILESGAGPSTHSHPEAPRQVAVVPPTVQGGARKKTASHSRMRRVYSHEHPVLQVSQPQVKVEQPAEHQQSSTSASTHYQNMPPAGNNYK